MKKIDLCNLSWKAFYVENERYVADGEVCDLETLTARAYPQIAVQVPGNFHRDLAAAGKAEEPYYGTNAQKDPCMYQQLFYYTSFDLNDALSSPNLVFEGIDTVADIYLNGKHIGTVDNMFIRHSFCVKDSLVIGRNQLLVHIRPAAIEARKFPIVLNDGAFAYNYASLHLRKAAHSFGWDIAPRLLSGGIWRPVYLEEGKQEGITQFYCYTIGLNAQDKTAELCFLYETQVLADDISRYSLHIRGRCRDSCFEKVQKLWHNSGKLRLPVQNVYFWYPRNYGQPDMYDITVTLYKDGLAIDTYTCCTGIRTVALERSSVTDENGSGEFCFLVNGQRIFAMGTNWVPVDALHATDHQRIPDILPMLSDLGCNIIRMWGGGIYEDDLVYDYCDENGIMIWQDFMMGCAVYPQDEDFCKQLKKEAISVIKRLRHHPSIVLWAGDNECDTASLSWFDMRRDPNRNILTRKVLAEALRLHDFTRPYLPSSPYIDEIAYAENTDRIPEDHLWGPRDYFKGSFYAGAVSHFVSEIGYHGCPSPESLTRFIPNQQLWNVTDADGWKGIENNDAWLAHATAMENDLYAPYTYRLRLMADQVTTLFGSSVPCTLEDFAKASQISQAEADKYFIEKSRIGKWRRTGIIWWNLIDGWPQISDAVVDYYYTKKLAYSYIKRAQKPVCLMADQSEAGTVLFGINDLQESRKVSYKVTDYRTGTLLTHGQSVLEPNSSRELAVFAPAENARWLIMEWNCQDEDNSNHFIEDISSIDYQLYMAFLHSQGYAAFEGF